MTTLQLVETLGHPRHALLRLAGRQSRQAGEYCSCKSIEGRLLQGIGIGEDERYGCGRAFWEYAGDRLGGYGTPMALMMLPYFTDSCIGSMEKFSAQTAPSLNRALAVLPGAAQGAIA